MGRSKGPAFKNGKGVSLHWDQEVSTTHGDFSLQDGQVVFKDVGSTNGSCLVENDNSTIKLAKNEITVMVVGSRLKLGSTILRVEAIEDV